METTETKPVKLPRCKLSGTDDNAFAVIGAVSRALKDAKQPERAKEWTAQAMQSGSYDALLALAFEFVDVR